MKEKKRAKKMIRKLTIWAWDEAFNIKAANEAKEIYTKDHSDVEVEVVTMAQDDIVAKIEYKLVVRFV